MNELLRLTVLIFGICFFIANLYLLMKKRVGEKITIIWMFGTFLALLVSAFPQILNQLATAAGVSYPPSLLYLVAILVLFLITIYQSMQIATLESKLRDIAREVALMNQVFTLREAAAAMERVGEPIQEQGSDET